jgi:hypothetical protein
LGQLSGNVDSGLGGKMKDCRQRRNHDQDKQPAEQSFRSMSDS